MPHSKYDSPPESNHYNPFFTGRIRDGDACERSPTPTTDRNDIIRRLKARGDVDRQHEQPPSTTRIPTEADSNALGLDILRPRSALHRGDFREESESQHAISTSPVVPWHAQSHFLQRPRAASQASLSGSFSYQPPTSPLVHQANAADMPDHSPDHFTPTRILHPNLHRHSSLRAFPYQAHQPRRSIGSIGSLPQPPFPSARRPSISDASPLQHAPMVGSYEESILRGRMSTTPSKPLDFVAQIGVLGKGDCKPSLKCPPHVAIPFPAVFYSYASGTSTDPEPSPYVGMLDLENTLKKPDDPEALAARRRRKHQEHSHTISKHHDTSHTSHDDETSRQRRQHKMSRRINSLPGGSYRIPEIGQLQIIDSGGRIERSHFGVFILDGGPGDDLPGSRSPMYQSFTGASRRPRQVNLSGKNANPFAAANNALGGPQSAVQNAHLDRQQRQKQRQELNAAKTVQRVWRGHNSRTKTRDGWRQQWDAIDPTAVDPIQRLNGLLLFFSPSNKTDVQRLITFVSDHSLDTTAAHHHLRLEKACLEALKLPNPHRTDDLLSVLTYLATAIPQETSLISVDYYTTLSKLDQRSHTSIGQAVAAPLSSHLLAAYEGFVAAYLTTPLQLTTLDHFTPTLDFPQLIHAASNVSTAATLDTRHRLWLLGQFIYLTQERVRASDYVPVVARLLSSLAEIIAPEAPALDMTNNDYDRLVLAKNPTRVHLNKFLRDQLSRLVDKDAIRSLVPRPTATSETSMLDDTSDSQSLASYALILLRFFPLRADDIRMWLYLGPLGQSKKEDTIPAIAYFWKGMRSTSIFANIYRDPRAAVELLKAPKASVSAWKPPGYEAEHSKKNSDWRVILIFLELFTFVLKIMDDEEFLGANAGSSLRDSNNALPIEDLKDLTIFLKNLGFAMYFNSQEISESFEPGLDTLSTANLSRHFGGPSTAVESKPDAQPQTISVAGTVGM
ncbi:hypothetical protein D6D25_05457, partial [Aureobasidium pullulans]